MYDVSPQHVVGGKSRSTWPSDSVFTPTLSSCGRYHNALTKVLNSYGHMVLWIHIYPSVACTEFSDLTIRKNSSNFVSWNFGGQLFENVHEYRATNKNEFFEVCDTMGPENDTPILQMAMSARIVLLANGKPSKMLQSRRRPVIEFLRNLVGLLFFLSRRENEMPEHSLYILGTQRLQPLKVSRA